MGHEIRGQYIFTMRSVVNTYGYLMNSSGAENGHYVELLESKFHELLHCLLVQVEVDEDWYLSANQDVKIAVLAGLTKSGRDHYIDAGYFENRFPRPIKVDEKWYLAQYPDVAAAIKGGVVKSATYHFESDGFREGRLPEAGWSLLGVNTKTCGSKQDRFLKKYADVVLME